MSEEIKLLGDIRDLLILVLIVVGFIAMAGMAFIITA